MSQEQAAARGRPRRGETDAAINAATRQLLAEVGFADFTIEEVARRAGVGKPTIYRRHSSKSPLIAAALVESLASATPRVPDSGDVNRDVAKLLTSLVQTLTTTDFGPSMAALIEPATRDPELADIFACAMDERRLVIRELLTLAHTQGRLQTPNIETGIDVLLGAIYFRYLMSGLPLNQGFITDTVDMVIAPTSKKALRRPTGNGTE